MFVKVKNPEDAKGYWLYECDKVHVYYYSIEEVKKLFKDASFSCYILSDRSYKIILDDEQIESYNLGVISINTKTEQGYNILFDTEAFIMGDNGKTIERIGIEIPK